MPKYFHFLTPDLEFNHVLHSARCSYIKHNDVQCKRKTVIGLPMCWTHTREVYHVRIKPSLIHGAGKGLFVDKPNTELGEVVFKKDDHIVPYSGELIDSDELESRYGDYTAPYAVEMNKSMYDDASVKRGIGSLINHKITKYTNCRFSISRQNRCNIIAEKNIKQGDELYVNYGRKYKFNEPVQTFTDNRKHIKFV